MKRYEPKGAALTASLADDPQRVLKVIRHGQAIGTLQASLADDPQRVLKDLEILDTLLQYRSFIG